MDKPTVYLSKRDSKVYGLREPTPVQIVCGDCSVRQDESGNAELLPLRTFLAMDGRCYTCAGRSFVIASELCSALRRTIAERRQYLFEEGFAHSSTRGREARERELWVGPEAGNTGGPQPRRAPDSDYLESLAGQGRRPETGSGPGEQAPRGLQRLADGGFQVTSGQRVEPESSPTYGVLIN